MSKNPESRFVPDVKGENLLKSPTILKPGFGESRESFGGLAESLSQQGHKVFTDEHPARRSQKEVVALLEETKTRARKWYAEHRPDISKEHLEVLLQSVPLTLFEEAYSLVEIILETTSKHEPVKVVGHSMGAAASVYAAFLWPHLFPQKRDIQSQLILLNPAGITGQEGVKKSKALEASGKVLQSKLEMVKEIPGDLKRQLSIMAGYLYTGIKGLLTAPNKETSQATRGGFLHILAELIKMTSRIEREAFDTSSTDVLEFLQIVQGNGVHISFILDSKDSLFPEKKIRERISKKNIEIQIHTTKEYGHFAPTKSPDEIATIITEVTTSQTRETSST